MFAIATGNQQTFEVGIYNQEVRTCVKENEPHAKFGDHWADVNYQNIVAESEEEARSIVTERYPSSQGFVIASLSKESRRY